MRSSSSDHALATRDSYWHLTQRPLQAMIFLLPLVLIYDVGLLYFGTQNVHDVGTGSGTQIVTDIYARRLLFYFFELFGATGYYLPGFAVIIVLLCWHIAARDRWRFEPGAYGWMAIESIVLAMPLFVLMMVMFRVTQPQPAAMLAAQMRTTALPPGVEGIIFSIGAGIYEELLFRLVAIALLHTLFVDVLALPEKVGAAGAIVLAAVCFALYHFNQPELQQLLNFNSTAWMHFCFYSLAGLYLGGVYVLRGFGIAVGAHTMYDVMVALLIMQQKQL